MLLTVYPWFKIVVNKLFTKMKAWSRKEYSFDVLEFRMRASESCSDEFEFRKTLMKVLKLNWQ